MMNLHLGKLLFGMCLYYVAGFTAAEEWTPPRTEFGQPDLQGFWTNITQTPIERPTELGDKRAYTGEEAQALMQSAQQVESDKDQPMDPNRPPPEVGGRIGQEADINFSDTYKDVLKVKGEYRTSMIIDPPDGRFPFAESGRNRDIHAQRRLQGFGPSDGPEIRTPGDRCLSRGIPPMVVPPYNANFQIVQTRDYVMLLGEMVHDARIIRLDEEHHPGEIKSWLGDSVGHWEGDTLVVHTKNFRPEISHFRLVSSDQLELTERIELVNENEVYYSVTVTDPQIYSQPFTEELSLHRHGPGDFLYEYACHEGNYGLAGILAGARREEQDAK
ncbi:MAG: hypothetical protein WD772_12450 [Pseudohongiellaceae bacterium]